MYFCVCLITIRKMRLLKGIYVIYETIVQYRSYTTNYGRMVLVRVTDALIESSNAVKCWKTFGINVKLSYILYPYFRTSLPFVYQSTLLINIQ